jgi:hypothetical protein
MHDNREQVQDVSAQYAHVKDLVIGTRGVFAPERNPLSAVAEQSDNAGDRHRIRKSTDSADLIRGTTQWQPQQPKRIGTDHSAVCSRVYKQLDAAPSSIAR